MGKSNLQAVFQLQSWFDAVGVPCAIEPGGGADLVIQNVDGALTEIVVSPDMDARGVSDGAVHVDAAAVTGRDIDRSLNIFKDIVEAAGYGRPDPVGRGAVPAKKLHFRDNFELVAMRHRDLRRAPNPPTESLEKYRPVLKKICWNFLRSNMSLCHEAGLQHDDLMTYALVYATTFVSLYERREEADAHENKRLLTEHVKQKFAQFRDTLFRKLRNCTAVLIDNDMQQLGTYGEIFNKRAHGDMHAQLDVNLEDAEEAVAEGLGMSGDWRSASHGAAVVLDVAERLMDVFGPANGPSAPARALKEAGRQAAAVKTLRDRLASLPHAEMISILSTAVKNKALCSVSRREARRQLQMHTDGCQECATLSSPDGDEQPQIADARR